MASATLRVGADISEFQKATRQMNEEMKTLDSAMKASASAAELADDKLKGLKDQQSLLAEKVKIASDAVQNQKNYIDTLAEKQEKLKTRQSELITKIAESTEKWEAAKSQYGKNSDEAKKLADELAKLEKQQKNNDNAIDSNISKINVANKKLSDNETQLNKTEKALKDVSKEINSFKLNEFSNKLDTAGTRMRDIGGMLSLGVTAPIVAAGTAMVKLASDYNESLNKVSVAFGDNASEVINWSETTLGQFGIASGSALDMAALFGDMGTAMGLSTGEASKMSMSLTGLAGDLASFKNIGIDQAQDALKGVFTGEGEALKTLGIVMQDSTLEAYALANGYSKTYDEMSQAEKVALRYAFVMDATKNSQGDFARTSDGTANSLRTFQEAMKELGAEFGQNILPVLTPFIQKLTEMAKGFGDLPPQAQQAIVGIGGIAAAIGPLLMVFGGMAGGLSNILGLLGSSGLMGGMSGAAGATGGLSAAFTALTGPVGIAVASIAAIGAVIAGAWQNSEVFRNSVGSAFESVKTTIQDAFARISEAMGPALASFQGFSADLSPILQQIGDFLGNNIVPIVKSFFENFINGFANVIVAIAPFIEGLGNLLAFIGNFVGAVFALFNGDWASAWTFAQAMGQSFVDFLGNALAGMQNMFFLVFGNLITKIQETWTNIQTSTTEAWNAVTAFLKESCDAIYNNTIGKITETAKGVADKWQETKQDSQQKWNDIKQDLATKWNEIYANVTEKVKATTMDVAQKWEDAKLDADMKWSDIRENLRTKVGEIYENTIGKAQNILEELALKWEKIKSDAGTKWDEIKQRISSAVSGLPDELKAIAMGMINKMVEGITETASNVYDAVTGLVNQVITKFKEGFGINSPSKVLKEIGQFMVQGLINGLSGDNLMAFVNNIVDQIKTAFSNGALNVGNIMATLGSSAMDFLSKLGINMGGLGFSAAGLNGKVWGSPTGSSVFNENFAWDEDFGDRAGSVGSQYHEGLDFNDTVGEGTPLYAIQNGMVSSAGYNGGYGNQVIIDFGNGIAASYSHLDSIGVEAGQSVVMGQYIGSVGNTGSSYGAHLHFGLLINGEYVDPMMLWSGASYDVGSRYVPEDMIAKIHKGEAIIPAKENPYANSGGPVLPQSKIEFTQNNYSPKELSPSESARYAKRGFQELGLMMG
ncbi:MAG: phage tail tape measure protein [Acetobacterium woodii]|nr:phage tail tape measure protein [Acetobacterium woodii]